LDLHVLHEDTEVDEGFLLCTKCDRQFPIVGKIAIMRDFANYLSVRPRLGGEMALAAKTPQLKSFVKRTLSQAKKGTDDISLIEKRWAQIYTKNRNSKFYLRMRRMLASLHLSGNAIEHGCSIGITAQHMTDLGIRVFGIDKSYYALSVAKQSADDGAEYVLADSMEHPFGKMQFDLVVGLNIFELIEPKPLLKMLAGQTRKGGFLFLSDPYDFERGAKSVREPLCEDSVRGKIKSYGFTITQRTQRPSRIAWNLRLYDRAILQYLVDVVVAKKSQTAA
jgi:2-polyprenyl-3-methyl-5-hydroxy-6-metoxy-1,4-benzoquinol methylase